MICAIACHRGDAVTKTRHELHLKACSVTRVECRSKGKVDQSLEVCWRETLLTFSIVFVRNLCAALWGQHYAGRLQCYTTEEKVCIPTVWVSVADRILRWSNELISVSISISNPFLSRSPRTFVWNGQVSFLFCSRQTQEFSTFSFQHQSWEVYFVQNFRYSA